MALDVKAPPTVRVLPQAENSFFVTLEKVTKLLQYTYADEKYVGIFIVVQSDLASKTPLSDGPDRLWSQLQLDSRLHEIVASVTSPQDMSWPSVSSKSC